MDGPGEEGVRRGCGMLACSVWDSWRAVGAAGGLRCDGSGNGVGQSWVMERVYKGQEVPQVSFSTHPIIKVFPRRRAGP